ncbi:MAG: spermidine/putrescine ABC transporter substrate-binding protein [Actinomycetota bacterium]|nr:spermidine/putrescine ABC transporter substrate-binding protein [Actinomycetota bacterium]
MTDQLNRRELIERAAAGGALLTVPGLLAACGGKKKKSSSSGGSKKHKLAKTLRFSNWTLYIDVKKGGRPSLDQFQKKYGVHVKYIEDIDDNASFFGKIRGPLSRGQSVDRDLIVMTDNSRYPALLIQKGWVEKLDKSAIPNIKNLQPALQHPNWDPDREYSLPWQSGMTGIGWNDKLTDPVLSMDQLLDDKKLKGRVALLTEMADTLSLVMLANGDDPAKVTDAAFDKAIKRIQKAVDSGQIRQFTGNSYSGPLAKGDLAAAMAWSGDIIQLLSSNKHLHWNLPEAGGDIWTDNMLIPKGGNVYTASVYMNYVYDPKVAAQIEASVSYICPVAGAREELLKRDPAAAKNTLIFPTKKMLDNVHIIDSKALSNQKYLTTWQNLITA